MGPISSATQVALALCSPFVIRVAVVAQELDGRNDEWGTSTGAAPSAEASHEWVRSLAIDYTPRSTWRHKVAVRKDAETKFFAFVAKDPKASLEPQDVCDFLDNTKYFTIGVSAEGGCTVVGVPPEGGALTGLGCSRIALEELSQGGSVSAGYDACVGPTVGGDSPSYSEVTLFLDHFRFVEVFGEQLSAPLDGSEYRVKVGFGLSKKLYHHDDDTGRRVFSTVSEEIILRRVHTFIGWTMSIPDSDNRVWMPSESMKTGRDGVFAVAVCSDKYRAGLRPVVTSECYTPSEVCAVTAGAGLLNVHFQIEGVVTHGTSLVLAANVCHESEGQTFCNSVFVNVPPGNGQNHCGITTGEFDFAKYLRALMVVGSSVTENSIVYEATASGLVHKDTPSKISSTPMVQLVSNPADILWMEGQEVQLVGLSLLHKAVDKDALVENAFANVAVDTTQGRIVFTGASEEHLQEDLIKDGVIQRDDRVAEVINFREGSQASEGVLKVTNSFLGAGPFATQVADGIGPDLNKLMIQHHKKEEGGNFFTAGFKRAHLINPQMPGVLVGQDVETMFAAYYRLLDSGVAAAGEGSVRRLLDSNGGLAISKTLKYVATQDSDLLGKQTVLLRVWVSYTDFCLAADKDRIGKFLDWTADDWADLTVLDADIDPLLKQLACDKRREESEGGRGTVTWRFSAALLGFNKTKGMEYEGVQGLEYPALAGTSFPPTAEEQSDWVMPFGVVMGVVLVAVFVFGVFYVRGGCHKSPPNLREAKNQSNWKPQGKTPPSEVPTNDVGNARGLQSAHQPSDSAV